MKEIIKTQTGIKNEICDLSPRDEFSELMKLAREKAGFSPERISTASKISLSFITALENGHFEQIPGNVFARGFIRSLCKIYKTPHQPLLEAFEKAINGPCVEKSATINPQKKEDHAQRTREKIIRIKIPDMKSLLSFFSKINWRMLDSRIIHHSYFKMGIPLVIFSIILGNLLILNKKKLIKIWDKKIAEKITIIAKTSLPGHSAPFSAKVETAKIETQAPPPSQLPPPVPEQKKTEIIAPQITDPEKYDLIELQIKEPVKIKYSIDDGERIEETIDPSSRKYEFRNNAVFQIYNPAALNILFNGKDLGPVGEKGKIKRITFRKSDDSLKTQAKM
ncbi:MAG: helix-turn-helix domain-containing protein [Oligoflexales bacterium]|nr:helix-turn-helix domain-containing protein [Oligoflexales bacterium]